MKKLKLFLMALCASAWVNTYAVDWTDKTSLITNPSFETDEAIADLTTCGWATDRVAGWTIAPSSSGSAQIGVGNSSSTIQGIGSTFEPYAGDKYFYTRNNWNANTTYTFTQVITRDGNNMPAGLYKLTCKAATYSSNAAFNTLTLGLKEGTGSAVTHNGIVLNVWNTWGVIVYKRAADTDLTIEVTFKPGYGTEGGKHYALLMDDFHLEYISENDAFTASSSNTIDFSDIINNAGIYNHSTKGTCPRGWTAFKHTTGNGNYTEGEKGDTRLEGWNGGNLDIDYYQQITNLPAGTYTVTALTQERAQVGRTYVYAYTEGQNKATGLVNSSTETNITTSALKVTNGTMNIGIESTANDWVTADNFRISFLGFDVDAVKANYETSYSNATTAKDATENANIVGTERTTFEDVITTYTTTETQSYSWYVAAKEALDNAIAAFEAVRTNYDALAREITKAAALGFDGSMYAATSSSTAATALENTQSLKVNEYTYVTNTYKYGVDLGAWTTEGYTADNSGQHWDNTTASKYKEQENSWGDPKKGYAAQSWSIKFYQSINLPAGNYVFKVAGRKASGSATTMSLDVTKASDNSSLGSVNDFPEGDTGLGINTNGETDYTTGEGHTYANNGAGRGWEWRYVKFTLDSDAEVKIAVNAEATAYSQWISFCNYTVLTDNDANVALIEYNVALANAQTIIADGTYANVTGSEKTALQNAIAADDNLDKTNATAIDEAKNNLVTATNAFTGAKSNYDAFEAAKAVDYPTLAYATTAKRTALDNAQAAADATSANDADTKTAAIQTAARQYYESHALAEGVTGAEDKTDLISNPNFDGVTISGTSAGAWTFDQTGGSANINSNEPFTDGNGNSNYSYFDYYNGSNNNQNIHQVIKNLAPGRYLLTATGRAHANFNGNFQLYVVGKGNVKIPGIGNTAGTFDRGWNDVSIEFNQTETSDVTIGAQTNNGKAQWWGVTRFRLVKLPTPEVAISEEATDAPQAVEYANVTLTRTLSPNYWNTFTSPVEITAAEITEIFGEGSEVREMNIEAAVEDNVIPFKDATSIVAGVPYLVKPARTVTNPSFTGKAVVAEGQIISNGDYKYIGILAKTHLDTPAADATALDLYLSTSNTMKKPGENGANLKGMRAYFNVPAAAAVSGVKLFIEGETDAITVIDGEPVAGATIYNIAGQRVNKAQKGIYIVNGKKVLVK